MKLFFFDLETTGTAVHRHGIHQISGKIIIDGKEMESFDFHVQPNPQAQIDPEALKVAGVTEEQVKAYPPMGQIYVAICAMLAKYVDKYNRKDKFYLVGYNIAAFDNQFFRAFFKQNGDEYFGSWFYPNCLDVYVLATPHIAPMQPNMVNVKQGTVAKALGIPVDEDKLHDAKYDIDICHAIYDKVCGKY